MLHVCTQLNTCSLRCITYSHVPILISLCSSISTPRKLSAIVPKFYNSIKFSRKRTEYQYQREDQRKIPSPVVGATATSNRRHRANSCRSISQDESKYWSLSDRNRTKKSSTIDRTYDRRSDRKYGVSFDNFSTYPHSRMLPTVEPTLASTTYDYHVTQLERFLDEYRRLYTELAKMKETCDKFSREEELGDYLYDEYPKNRMRQNGGPQISQRECWYNLRSSSDKFDSRSSLRRHLSLKSRSFNNQIPSKSSSLERSVSFVPAAKYGSVKPAAVEDSITPKSILKKKNEESYNVIMPYISSTLPLRRNRIRRFSDSSAGNFFD